MLRCLLQRGLSIASLQFNELFYCIVNASNIILHQSISHCPMHKIVSYAKFIKAFKFILVHNCIVLMVKLIKFMFIANYMNSSDLLGSLKERLFASLYLYIRNEH